MMTKLWMVTTLCTIVVVLADVKQSNFLTDGRAQAKLTRLVECSHNVAETYRHLAVHTPGSKARLADCANKILNTYYTVLYGLNQGIASVKNQPIRQSLCQIAEACSEQVQYIQGHLCGDSDKLRLALATTYDKVNELASKISKDIEAHDCKAEIFFGSQLRKILNEAIYTAENLKFEFEFSKKTNKELVPVIDDAFEEFSKIVLNLKNNDYKVKEELIYLIENLERVGDLMVVRLENFVHIDVEDHKHNAMVLEVSKAVGAGCCAIHELICGNYDVAHIKIEFEKVHKAVTASLKKLSEVNVEENSPRDLLIRSVLFDNIAVSKVYARELSLVP